MMKAIANGFVGAVIGGLAIFLVVMAIQGQQSQPQGFGGLTRTPSGPHGLKPVSTPTPGSGGTCVGSDLVGTEISKLGPTDTMWVGGSHANGIYYIGDFKGTEKVTIEPEEIVLIVFNRDDPMQNRLPFGANNISGRSGHGAPTTFIPTLDEILTDINATSGSTAVSAAQIEMVIVLPIDDCRRGANWSWPQAIQEAYEQHEIAVVQEAMFNGNWDSSGKWNPTVWWANF
jgi:hypothetical protein